MIKEYLRSLLQRGEKLKLEFPVGTRVRSRLDPLNDRLLTNNEGCVMEVVDDKEVVVKFDKEPEWEDWYHMKTFLLEKIV